MSCFKSQEGQFKSKNYTQIHEVRNLYRLSIPPLNSRLPQIFAKRCSWGPRAAVGSLVGGATWSLLPRLARVWIILSEEELEQANPERVWLVVPSYPWRNASHQLRLTCSCTHGSREMLKVVAGVSLSLSPAESGETCEQGVYLLCLSE